MDTPQLSPWLAAFLLAACLLGSAFCSGAEIGFMTVSRVRLRRLAAAGERRVASLLALLDRLEEAVLTLLVGANVFQVLTSALVTVVLVARFGERGAAAAVVVATVLTTVFGELVPKVVYREYPERLTVASVGPLRALMILLAPVRVPLNAYARLLRRLTGRSGSAGGAMDRLGLVALLVEDDHTTLQDRHFRQALDAFLRLSGTTVADLMRPLAAVTTVPHDASLGGALAAAADSGYSRLPVLGPGPADVSGYLLARDLLFTAEEPGADLAGPVPERLVRSILEVDGNLRPYELFEELHHQQHQLALVVDREGRPRGLLTLEDLIEKVTGSISDEFDPIVEATP